MQLNASFLTFIQSHFMSFQSYMKYFLYYSTESLDCFTVDVQNNVAQNKEFKVSVGWHNGDNTIQKTFSINVKCK